VVPPITIKTERYTIGLDNGKGDYSFYSHAHFDHIKGVKRAKRPIASYETAVLAGIKHVFKAPKCVSIKNAGHIVGAKQIAIEVDGERIVYTGDIKLKDTILTKGGEIVNADRLIIDATYGIAGLKFPNPFDVYNDIAKWIKEMENKVILFKTYVLGKPQELIKVINEYTGKIPYVSKKIAKYSSLYKKIGIKLEYNELNIDSIKPGDIIISSGSESNSIISKIKNIKVAAVTGWSLLYRLNVDKAFPLSDHSDFYEILEYIKSSEAKKVYFITSKTSRGIRKAIKRYLKR